LTNQLYLRGLEWAESRSGREIALLSLAALFVLVAAISLSLAQESAITWPHLVAPLVWVGVIMTAAVIVRRYRPNHNQYLLPLVGLTTGWGLVLLDRLAPNFLWRQLVWSIVGAAAMVTVAVLPRSLRWLRRYRYTWMIAGLLLLLATFFFGVNPSGRGAELWLPAPFVARVYFQPSELLKLLLVVFLASYFDEHEHTFRRPMSGRLLATMPYLAPLLLMWGFSVALLVWQRDLGAATLFFALFIGLLYVATGRIGYVLAGLALLVVAGALAYFAFDVVALRIDAWWNPWPEADDRAFQIVQSLYAVAAGGLLGQGVGQGFPDYIPVVHSDFVYAAVAEEWGLVGALAVIACFALLAHQGLSIAARATRPFHGYLAAGVTIVLTFQSLLIMGGVAKALPLTGVTLPFISYGGSSLVVSQIMIGLLLFISADGVRYGRS
jgi:cell division protein FtsW (lipid II flippase)